MNKLLSRAAEALTGDPVEAAKAKIDALAKLEMKHFSRFRELGREIEAARATGGDEIINAEIDGGPLPEIARRLTELAGERESASLAMSAARSKRREAILCYFAGQARELRGQAEGLRDQSAKLKVASDKLLAQLKVVECCDFVPLSKLLLCQLASGAQFADATRAGVECEIGNTWPKSELLATRADMLSRQADELERQAVPDSGAASAASVDALLAAVLGDGLTLGPELPTVAAWAAGQERAIRERHPRAIGVRFTLCWRRSEITDRSEAAAVLDPNIGRTEAPPCPRAAWDAVLAAMPGKRARA